MELTRELREWVEAQARAAGFDLAGVASVPEPDSVAAAEAAIAAKAKGDYSAATLQKYQQILEEGFVLKDLKKYKRALTFTENPRLHNTYPDLICELAQSIFTISDSPREKILAQALRSLKGKISWTELLKDGRDAGRAMLW